MEHAVAANDSVPSASARARRSLVASLVETTKPRITRLVTITALVGFVLAAIEHRWTWPALVLAAGACAIGTSLAAAGANALNQWLERDRDALMNRTSGRPLPAGHLRPSSVLALGIGLSACGVAILLTLSGALAAALAATCVVVYVALYTPLKVRTGVATLVGTIPGAIPPVIGWACASRTPGDASWWSPAGAPGALSLFALMTVWQIPHFLAIAWMYREDYLRGGFRVMSVARADDRPPIVSILAWSVALLPATLLPGLTIASLGTPYIAIAAVTGAAFVALAIRLALGRTRADARRLFIASVIHLPVLLVAMVAESLLRVLSSRA